MLEPSCARPGVDPEVFFQVDSFTNPELSGRELDVENTRRNREAKKVCRFCPVKQECLERNLLEPHGFFGGYGVTSRRMIAAERGIAWPGEGEDMDFILVERAVSGHQPELNPAERRAAVLQLRRRPGGKTHGNQRMTHDRMTSKEIAEIVGCNPRTVQRILKDADADRRFLSA